jgi:copper chaperone
VTRTMTTQLKIEGMTCGHCVAGVKSALEALEGVNRADVKLEPGSAIVEHAPETTPLALIAAVEEEGYKAQASE